jgi:DNA polymerase IV
VEAQGRLLAIFSRFTDLVEPVSIDEAFLDVTGSRRLFGTPQMIGARIAELVRDELGLSCSIGIGPTKTLAKLAAELDKPGGLTTLTADDVHGRLRALPAGDLSGIGPVTVKRLAALGIHSIGELQDAPQELLLASFGNGAAWLTELAFGGADSPVRSERPAPKSHGHEVTFARDTADPEFLRATLLDLADRVAGDVRRQGRTGRTVVVRLRDARFRTTSRQRTLPAATSTTRLIYEVACALLAELHEPGRPLRLVGLTLTGLSEEAGQGELQAPARERVCDEAVDKVRARFGDQALRRAGCEAAGGEHHGAGPRPGSLPQ